MLQFACTFDITLRSCSFGHHDGQPLDCQPYCQPFSDPLRPALIVDFLNKFVFVEVSGQPLRDPQPLLHLLDRSQQLGQAQTCPEATSYEGGDVQSAFKAWR